jgi:hypothetical protein
LNRQTWINFLSLLPGSSITVLAISIAFLRFYDQTDFATLGFIPQPRDWSNRLTVAAILAVLANFGVEWNRRNRETNRLAEEEQRRTEEEQRAARRARITARCRIAQIQFQLDPREAHRQDLSAVLALLQEYQDTL